MTSKKARKAKTETTTTTPISGDPQESPMQAQHARLKLAAALNAQALMSEHRGGASAGSQANALAALRHLDKVLAKPSLATGDSFQALSETQRDKVWALVARGHASLYNASGIDAFEDTEVRAVVLTEAGRAKLGERLATRVENLGHGYAVTDTEVREHGARVRELLVTLAEHLPVVAPACRNGALARYASFGLSSPEA